MTPTLDDLKQAIAALPFDQVQELERWLKATRSEHLAVARRREAEAMAAEVQERGMAAVAAAHGLTPMVIYQRIHRAGIKMARRTAPIRQPRTKGDVAAFNARLFADAKEHGSKRAALMHGLTAKALHARLQRAGLFLRLPTAQSLARLPRLAERCCVDGPELIALEEGITLSALQRRFQRAGMRMPWKGEQGENATTEQGAA